MAANKMCPYCGWLYDPDAKRWANQAPHELVPTHDYPPPCRAVCPGSKQHPRNPETDNRPLWKDLPEGETRHTESIRQLAAEGGGRRCERCGGTMMHSRLKGRCCTNPACPGLT